MSDRLHDSWPLEWFVALLELRERAKLEVNCLKSTPSCMAKCFRSRGSNFYSEYVSMEVRK